MNERALQIRVGIVMLGSLLLAGVLVVLFAELPTLGKTVTLELEFAEATGVSEDTPVRKSGILIGRVDKVELTEDGEARVTITVKDDTVRQNDVARIGGSLLGDAVIEFVSRKSAEPVPFATEGELLKGMASADPLTMLTELGQKMPEATQQITDAGNAVEKLADRLNKMLGENDEQFERIANKTETALDNFNKAMVSFDQVFGDEAAAKNLRESLVELPKLLKDMGQTFNDVQRTVRLADRNLQNLEGFTKPLGERGEQITSDLERATGLLDDLLTNVVQFTDALNRKEGTLAQLVHNPELYDRLNLAAKNISDLSSELRPIMRDARVLTDKLARNPELLGLRGAMKPSNGTKYPNFSRPVMKPIIIEDVTPRD